MKNVTMSDPHLIWVGDEDQFERQLRWLGQIVETGIPKQDRSAILGMIARVDSGKVLSQRQQEWARDLYIKHKALIVAESTRRIERLHPGISAAMHDHTYGKAICAAVSNCDDQQLQQLLQALRKDK